MNAYIDGGDRLYIELAFEGYSKQFPPSSLKKIIMFSNVRYTDDWAQVDAKVASLLLAVVSRGLSHVRMCPWTVSIAFKNSVNIQNLPLLQLVMIDSSVNSNQHNGSTSITLDCNQSAAIHSTNIISWGLNSYHDWWQHSCGSPRFNRVLDGMVLIALIGRAGIWS